MYQKPLMIHSRERLIYLMDWLDPDGEVENKLLQFSNLVKAPEEVHTFHVSPYSIWSAAAKDIEAEKIVNTLEQHSCNRISSELRESIIQWVQDFGTLHLIRKNNRLKLVAKHQRIITKILQDKDIRDILVGDPEDDILHFKLSDRIKLKERLFDLDLFVIDSANVHGESLELNIKHKNTYNEPFELRPYQKEAVNAYYDNKDNAGGGGVIILPPGSGKTLVGLSVISKIKKSALIIVEDERCAQHWQEEIRDKTDLDPEHVSYYRNQNNEILPITISTYKYLASNQQAYQRMMQEQWGLIIYDDAHRLPADTYMSTTEIQSEYKLAMASTLARSDDRGHVVFALIGPVWYETFPNLLEKKGYLSKVQCLEVRIPQDQITQEKYANEQGLSNNEHRLRKIARFNQLKEEALSVLLTNYWDQKVLVVSFNIDLAKKMSGSFHKPILLTGVNGNQDLIRSFNDAERDVLFGTSHIVEQTLFPDLDILIAISFNKGSEREEYLRLGKLIGTENVHQRKLLYSLVTEKTIEEGDYVRRRRPMINYGYRYNIITYRQLIEGGW